MTDATCCMVLAGDNGAPRQCDAPVEYEGLVCDDCHDLMRQHPGAASPLADPTCCIELAGDGFDVRRCDNPVDQHGDVCDDCHAHFQQYRKRLP